MTDFNDTPISRPEEDLFGIDPLAQTIARCILKLQDPVGSVVAVHGRWGSGKSSLINLVGHHLANSEAMPTILRFQCWSYRTEETLAVGFIREIYAGLGPEMSQARKALQKLGARVAGTGPLLGAVAGAFGGPALGSVAGSAFGVIEKMIESDESDAALQREMVEALKKSSRRFVVVIDDIDRLSPEEALVIFRLVKSVGRLPNVIYLLAYDRAATEKAVEERYPSEGAHYLEKIVQAGFDLPEPSKSRLISMLNSRIAETFGEAIGDQHYFNNIFSGVAAQVIQTPRDVLRLSNSLSVTYQAVRGEVNPADFLAIETLRLFRPYMYQAIRSEKLNLVGPIELSRYGNHDEIAEQYEKLFLGREQKSDLHRLKCGLERLFPRLLEQFSVHEFIDDKEWERSRRVCSANHFDTYFRFSLSQHTVPIAEVQELLRRADEPEFVKATFLNALNIQLAEGRTKAAFLLDELTYHARDMDIAKVAPFLQSLYSIAKILCDDSEDFLDFAPIDNRKRMDWLTRALLLDRTELDFRSQILLEAIQNSSLDWLVYISDSVANDYRSPPDGGATIPPEGCLMTKEHSEFISKIALQRKQESADNR